MKLLSRIGRPHRLAIHVVLLLACFAFLAPRADAQFVQVSFVQVPDDNLRAAINRAIGQPAGVAIPKLQMALLTSLDASGAPDAEIVSLTGLEHATSLTSLDLSANAIVDVSPLEDLTKLTSLDLSANAIADVSPLEDLTGLVSLNLSDNRIPSIEKLSKLTKLIRLDLSNNKIVSFAGIQDLTKLTHLYLGNNGITSPSLDTALRTLLGKDTVNVKNIDILIVKDVTFPNAPATSYGAGDTVSIAVAFFNRGVRYISMSELARVPTVENGRYKDDPESEYYTGDKPYVALALDGALTVDGTGFHAEWEWDDALQQRNTTVRFEHIVPPQRSADAISINSLQVPANTRITHEYELIENFLQLLAPPSDVVGLHKTVDLPSALPTGQPIAASGPLFPTGTRTENMPESTLTTADILTLNAADPDTGDTITYSIEGGADEDEFTIAGDKLRLNNHMLNYESPTDQLSQLTDAAGNPIQLTDAEGNPIEDAEGNWITNRARDNQYVVVVQASSGTPPQTDLQRITVIVNDVNEPPGKPMRPTLTTSASAPNEMGVSWDEPSNTGPPIIDYDVQYRAGATGNFTDWPHTGTEREATLTGLIASTTMTNTTYYVRVLATNAEGTSDPSDPWQTTTPVNNAPNITTASGLEVDENETDIVTLAAEDTDSTAYGDLVTGYTLESGADAEYFQISNTGALTVIDAAGLDYETPVDKSVPNPDGNGSENNEYVIDIKVTTGTNKRELSSAKKRFVVTVGDVDEPPGIPQNLDVSGPTATPDTLIVTWEEGPTPESTTPPDTRRYVVQYRQADGGEEDWSEDNVSYPDERTETGAEISGLQLNTLYDVRVQAVNDDAESDWRIKEDVKPADNAAVRFETRQTTFSVSENTPITTPITTFRATDADAAVDLVTYALGDTADEAAFELDIDEEAVTGVLRFKAVPDFENPADLAFEDTTGSGRDSPAGDNVYIVSVTATSGEGARLSRETLWLTITVVDVVEFDNTPPVVERLTLVPPPAAGYTLGSEILAEVTFDDDGVDIPANLSRENRPFITLYLGEETAANRRRAYWKGRRDGNSTIVTFAYEVQETDFATAITVDKELGITVPPDAPIRNSAGTEVVTTPVRDTGAPAGAQEQSRLEFPEVTLARQPSGGTQPGAAPPTLTQEVLVSGTPVFIPPETVDGKFAASAVPRTPLIFNEFGNGADATNDWLELRNVTGAAVSLKDWELSVVQNGEKKDVSLIVFPDVSVPANGLLLISNSAPDKTPLAAGDDIAGSVEAKNGGLTHLSLVNSGLALPDDGKFLLILRNAKEKLGKNEAFVDVAGGGGSDTDAFIRDRTGNYDTHVWPLQVLDAPGGDTEDALGSGTVWQRAKANVVGYHKDAWTEAAFTGLGYDRQVTQSAATAGTPGYPNGAAKATVASPKGSVTISEIMVDTADGTLPQWIELYNRSKTEVLNLNRWQLELQNINSADLIGRPIVTLTLGEKLLQPNQTVLIVAGEARASSRAHLPADRIYNLFELHQKNLRVKTPRDTFLSNVGFYLKLTDSEGELVDEVGNTDGNRRTDDAPAWALPVSDLEGARSSLIRRYDKDVALNGKHRPSWVSAANIKAIDGELYYGHAKDLGTPGWRAGGALPVELAGFAVSRNDAGAVVLTWATESEVDNAGFNLRRSERRDGSFTLVNAALIAGAGTTGERQTYTFTDTLAKPGVEYYYQLEEVSFAGKPQTLAMRLLRGPVSASNRQLRTFGEIKREK